MNAFEDEKYQQGDDFNIPDEEIVRNFGHWGYRGYQEKRSHQKGPVIEVTVINAKGHSVTGTGETKEEAIEDIIEQIDRILDEQ